MSNKDVIYDLETYKNCFTFTIALANNPAKIRTFLKFLIEKTIPKKC